MVHLRRSTPTSLINGVLVIGLRTSNLFDFDDTPLACEKMLDDTQERWREGCLR